MISMKATSPLVWDIGWFGPAPPPDRAPGEERGIAFFVECMHCDRWCENHMVKCDSEEELVRLFGFYAARLGITMFKLYPEDFAILAGYTWKDPEYQAERAERVKKKARK